VVVAVKAITMDEKRRKRRIDVDVDDDDEGETEGVQRCMIAL